MDRTSTTMVVLAKKGLTEVLKEHEQQAQDDLAAASGAQPKSLQ